MAPEALRDAALEAARALLVEEGPQAVTLKAVGARIGKGHANLLHHFGSAAGLQRALAQHLATRITRGIAEAVLRARAGEADPRLIVDLTFDAFGREGGGQLAAWMILNGDRSALDPVVDAIRGLVEETGPHEGRPTAGVTLTLVLTALGDALLGETLAAALGLPRTAARESAAAALLAFAGAVPPMT
ncbi:TetR family transcriptional regulator [Sphingomonas jatrophae]|uniref:Transcriptional regulator, TetR family n=1 Tax=Sphingomonas jatrophae TaxID=1166337 RepID=A0A1I6K3H0_9SPHN|nr:TetR family transcriptional regulator [Sphingomonas jatrophae]SFR85791.1 transcriptional regulator, TetR family [Sphingomonas jatrophae]